MITCREVAFLASEQLDRKLPLRQRISLQMHLLMCRYCPRFRRQLLFLRAAAGYYGEETDEGILLKRDSLSTEAKKKIRRALAESALSPDKPEDSSPPKKDL